VDCATKAAGHDLLCAVCLELVPESTPGTQQDPVCACEMRCLI